MERLVEAVVQAGRVETAYVRAGHGLPVLLLVEGSAGSVAEGALFRALAASFRVIAPSLVDSLRSEEAPRDGEHSIIAWLRDVIEGLGLDRPHLVVSGEMAHRLLDFLGTEADLLGRVAILRPRPHEAGSMAPAPADGATLAAVRELARSPDVPVPPELIDFLAGESG